MGKINCQGEIKKPIIVLIIAAILILALVLLLVYTTFPTAGKAYTTLGGDTVTIEAIDTDTIALSVNINAKQSGTFYIEIDAVDLCSSLVDPVTSVNLLWNDFSEVSCLNDKLIIADATIDDTLFETGDYKLINIDLAKQITSLTLTEIDVYDATTGNDIFTENNLEFTIAYPTVPGPGDTGDTGDTGGSTSGGGSSGGRRFLYQCSDYIDNDQDGLTDYPKDPDCISSNDQTEGIAVVSGCVESWVCSEWTSCYNNAQTRTCSDEKQCGTTLLRPELSKGCGQSYVPGPVPSRTYPQTPYIPPETQQPESFWSKYLAWLIGIPLALIILAIIIILILHFHKKKHGAYNVKELEDWIEKERKMGASDASIRKILAQQTDWSQEEIDQAFDELDHRKDNPQKPTNKPGLGVNKTKPMYGGKPGSLKKPATRANFGAKKPLSTMKKPMAKPSFGAKKPLNKPKSPVNLKSGPKPRAKT